MSLDLAFGQLIAALNANTAALQAHQQVAPAQSQSFVQPTIPQGFQQAAPQQPMGMPSQPFPGVQQAPPPQPSVPQQQMPFQDAQGLMQWAYAKYQANNAIMPMMEAILRNHGLDDLTKAQPGQFASLFAAINPL